MRFYETFWRSTLGHLKVFIPPGPFGSSCPFVQNLRTVETETIEIRVRVASNRDNWDILGQTTKASTILRAAGGANEWQPGRTWLAELSKNRRQQTQEIIGLARERPLKITPWIHSPQPWQLHRQEMVGNVDTNESMINSLLFWSVAVSMTKHDQKMTTLKVSD